MIAALHKGSEEKDLEMIKLRSQIDEIRLEHVKDKEKIIKDNDDKMAGIFC